MNPWLSRLAALVVVAGVWTLLAALPSFRTHRLHLTTIRVTTGGDPAAIIQAVKAVPAPDGGDFRVQVVPPAPWSPRKVAGLFGAMFASSVLLVGSYRLARKGCDALFRER